MTQDRLNGWVTVMKSLVIPLILTAIVSLTGYLLALDRRQTQTEVKMEEAVHRISEACEATQRLNEDLVNIYKEQSYQSGNISTCQELVKRNAQALEKLIQMHLADR